MLSRVSTVSSIERQENAFPESNGGNFVIVRRPRHARGVCAAAQGG